MPSEKIHIEKGSVQETLIVPLYGRKMCAEKFPDLYHDLSAKKLCEKLNYDFSAQETKKNSFAYEFGALEVAMRQLDIMWEIREYLKIYPKATVVNLGCGLDQTGSACDNGTCRIVNVDLPDTIAVREELIPLGEREQNIACDLNDDSWMDAVDSSDGVIFFAAGVFYYFKREEVRATVLKMSERFPEGRLVFDTVGERGLKMMMSKVLKNMGMKDVKGFFSIDDPNTQLNWSEKIKVQTKGYMLGYYDMRSKGIRTAHRLLAKVGDNMLKMAIVRMDFLK